MQKELASILTVEQQNAIIALKQHFPFRICWGAVKAETNEFIVGANYDRRELNKKIRNGWLVYVAN